MSTAFKLTSNNFYNELLRSLRMKSIKKTNKFSGIDTLYEFRILSNIKTLCSILIQMKSAINNLSKTKSLQRAMIILKFYYISSGTLSDICASLLNDFFRIGMNEKDINLRMILRNEKIISTSLPQIWNKYEPNVRRSDFSRIRNDVAHRGILSDLNNEKLKQIEAELFLIAILGKTASQKTKLELQSELKSYLISKRTELHKHFLNTNLLFEEIFDELLMIYSLQKPSA